MNNLYEKQLGDLLTRPGSFQQTPGYQFARDQGMQAIQRSAAAKGRMGSGNVLTELSKFGTGLASQEYGSQMDRLGRLLGQEQQYGLGRSRLELDEKLGQGGLANQRRSTDLGFAQNMFSNMGQYELGQQQNQMKMLSDLMSYNLGVGRLGSDQEQNTALMLKSLAV